MTKKQQFIETFLKKVFNFDKVDFISSYGCMTVFANYKLNNNIWANNSGQVFRIWIDKTKTKGYSIKFKAKLNATEIPDETVALVKQRAQEAWPGATVDIYYRTEAYMCNVPTLRVRVKELPWR